jgi:thiol-disulfide isomerase/thioredoxin
MGRALRRLVTLLALNGALLGCARPAAISGSITGSDGAPLPAARAALDGGAAVDTGPDGSFRIDTNARGLVALHLAGVNHQPETVLVYLPRRGGTVTLNVRLAPVPRSTDLSRAAVIGDFNGFRRDGSAVVMDRLDDGRLIARVPADAGVLCQVVNVSAPVEAINSTHAGPPLSATNASGYEFLEDSGFASRVDAADGIATVVLDPATLPSTAPSASIALESKATDTALFAALATTLRREREEYARARLELKRRGAGADEIAAFVSEYPWDRLNRPVRELVIDAPRALAHAGLVLYASEAGALAEMTFSPIDPALAARAVARIDPAAPVWSAARDAVPALIWTDHHNPVPSFDSFLDRLVESHPDRQLRESVLSYAISVAHFAGAHARLARMYQVLQRDFPESAAFAQARKLVSPEKRVVAGRPVPDFSVPSIDDASVISNESLLGSVYLVDFWGSWCGPCLAEMPHLHEAYQRYRALGFTIVSLSCDETPATVQAFRAGPWPMPWLHGFLDQCYESRERNALVEAFEVVGFPTTILVGTDGKVLETGPALRGNRLGETLARTFAAGAARAEAR